MKILAFKHLYKIPILLTTILLCCSVLQAQKLDLAYYLPQDIPYDANIPTPESFLGYEVGEWHVGHSQVHYYLQHLAEKSPRMKMDEYARSHEQRPLSLVYISSEENLKNLEEIRKNHLALSDPSIKDKPDFNKQKLVVYLGHSVHGNESSGTNAALLVAYYLAAAESDYVKKLLDNTVILLDPCLNPDGVDRFASWVNRHKNKTLNPDNADREYDMARWTHQSLLV